MKNTSTLLAFVLLMTGFVSYSQQKVDLIIHHATIYTVDSAFSMAEAMAIREDKIVAIGNNESILKNYDALEKFDAKGKAVFPGFIDAHCHFYNYGLGLNNADLTNTKSFDEVLAILQRHAKEFPENWLLGRGWDQNKWNVKEFPSKEALDSLFPDRPVMITRIDGHAVLVNQAALTKANITIDTKIEGGVIETKKNSGNGNKIHLTGILIDNAIDLMKKVMPSPSKYEMKEALVRAQKNCFEVGLTTVDDAGLEKDVVHTISDLQNIKTLKMRVYAMLNPTQENKDYAFQFGVYKSPRLNVRSFKLYADGALGSRGACLLSPYSDKPEQQGFLLDSMGYYKQTCEELYNHGFQVNTHCIGDSGVRAMLHVYAELLKGKNDLRWRIEHSQVVNENDFDLYGKNSIIPSVQPTHATSDMYWAEARLGKKRVKNAYAYKLLLQQNGMVATGSDFPVESINPLFGFYAAVTRKDQKDFPANGFQTENKLSRMEALKGMTIWAAYSNFEEHEKGSLEAGKFADFVILDQDIMKIKEQDLYKVKVLQTFLAGEKVFERNK